MTTLSNEVFAKNLRMYMKRKRITQKELAEVVGVSAPTMHDYLKGKKYPRIDKIEILANYFGILKSDLIEEKSEEHKKMQSNNEELAQIVVRMRSDKEFLSLVKTLNTLEAEKIQGVKQMLLAFLK